jgi:predicted MFS family arabinose efflux permease
MSVSPTSTPATPAPSIVAALLPIMAVAFVACLVSGLALPVLPLHVHVGLGHGTFVVGLIAGSQFVAAMLARLWAGHYADSRGAKRAVATGLLAATGVGVLYLLSLAFVDVPVASAAILLLGQALLGGTFGFITTGAISWGLALVPAQHAGTVIAWIGTAIYAAMALGAPAGTALYTGHGFAAVALVTAALPLLALLIVLTLHPVAPLARARPALLKVVGAVWIPGLGLTLSSLGYGAITAFLTLLFADRGWSPLWPGITLFAVCFILARVVLGRMADRIGGAKVALMFVVIEAAGLAMIWLAPWSALALLGAALTGFGYSLVYPGYGVEAVRRAPPESRGLAMGAYTAFLDLALGLASPSLGLVASRAGLDTVYLVSALAVLGAALIAARLLRAGASR